MNRESKVVNRAEVRHSKTKALRDIGRENTLWLMTADALREAIRSGRPFKVTMADGRTLAIPHS